MDLQSLQKKATRYLQAYEGFRNVNVSVENQGNDQAIIYLDGHDFFIGVDKDIPLRFEPGYIKHVGGSYNEPPDQEDCYFNVGDGISDGCYSLAEACSILVQADYLDSLNSIDLEDAFMNELEEESELAEEWLDTQERLS